MAKIAPWISVPDGNQALQFYQRAFGAKQLYVLGDGGKTIVAQLAIEEADFWIQEDAGARRAESEGPIRMIVTVDDPDRLFKRALAAGANEVFAMQEEHGWRTGRLEDPFGHHWEIGRRLKSE